MKYYKPIKWISFYIMIQFIGYNFIYVIKNKQSKYNYLDWVYYFYNHQNSIIFYYYLYFIFTTSIIFMLFLFNLNNKRIIMEENKE